MPPPQPPGWYHAQGDPPGTQRWWDGAQWVGGPAPVAPVAPPVYGAPGYGPPGYGYGAPGYGAPGHGAVGYGYGAPVRPNYAGWWQRVGASVLDTLVMAVPLVVLAVIGVLAVPTESTICRDIDDRPYVCRQPTGAGWALIVGLIAIGLVIYLGYQTYFVGRTGQTLGRKATGIMVVDRHKGVPIGMGRAFGRYLLTIVFGAACGLLQILDSLWPLWDDEKQTLRDKATNAIVIRKHGS